MPDMTQWTHKDEWRRIGDHFCIVVSRHSVPPSEIEPSRGIHRWAVYAYLYPTHWHFGAFEDSKDMFQAAARALPFHCGPSFLTRHRMDDGSICSVQIGADYDHLCDSHYTHYATAEQAASVFADADELFAWLEKETPNE